MATETKSAATIQEMLEKRKQSLNRRLTAIQGEFAPMAQISGDGLPGEPEEPMSVAQMAGIAFGAALAMGLIVSLSKRTRRRGRFEGKTTDVHLYIDHLVDEAARLTARGKNAEDAVRKVLRRKQPVVQIQTPDQVRPTSILSEVLSTVTRTMLVLAVEAGVEAVIARAKATNANPSAEE